MKILHKIILIGSFLTATTQLATANEIGWQDVTNEEGPFNPLVCDYKFRTDIYQDELMWLPSEVVTLTKSQSVSSNSTLNNYGIPDDTPRGFKAIMETTRYKYSLVVTYNERNLLKHSQFHQGDREEGKYYKVNRKGRLYARCVS